MRPIFSLNNGILQICNPIDESDVITYVIESQARKTSKTTGEFTGEQIYTQLLCQAQKAIEQVSGESVIIDIFNEYKSFSNIINYPTSSRKHVLQSMQSAIGRIMNKVLPDWQTFEKYIDWLVNSGDLYINPEKVADQFVYNENLPNTEKETYTKVSYTQLLSLALVLRIAHPMWSSIIFAYKGKEGNSTTTYMSCLASLKGCSVVMDSPVHEKLRNYITFATRNYDYTQIENYDSEVSSQDIVDFIMAKCLVDKATRFDHRPSPNKDATLIAALWHCAVSVVDRKKRSVKAKNIDNGTGPESSSQLEDYKTHTTMTSGARASIDVYMSKHWYSFVSAKFGHETANAVSLIRPSVLDRLKIVHVGQPFERAHKVIAAMVYKDYVSPNSFDQILKDTTYEAFATVLSLMIVKDYKEMACVFASRATDASTGIGKHSLSEHLFNKIEQFYPKSFRSQVNRNSPGVQIVHELYTALTGVARISAVPIDILNQWQMSETYISTNNLKDAIAEFEIFCFSPSINKE